MVRVIQLRGFRPRSARPKIRIVTDNQLLEGPTFKALASGGVHTLGTSSVLTNHTNERVLSVT